MGVSLALVFAVFAALTCLIEAAEHARDFAGRDASLAQTLELTLLSAPSRIYTLLPLVTVIASLVLFLRLAASSELVVIRGAGRSGLRTLLGPCAVALGLGVIAVTLFNPIVAATSTRFDARSSALAGTGASVLSVTAEGIWFRQGGANGQTVIRARGTNTDGTVLRDASFIEFNPEGAPQRRIDAEFATLIEGGWRLETAKIWPLAADANPEANALADQALFLPSDLTADRIRDSFVAPQAIPFWALPEFITALQDAGFAAKRHLVWLHMELASPVFLIAMTLIGASLTMAHARGARGAR
ncbi:MAG: LptF/LptG family permease, partial [Pseudomonadota bacterium]